MRRSITMRELIKASEAWISFASEQERRLVVSWVQKTEYIIHRQIGECYVTRDKKGEVLSYRRRMRIDDLQWLCSWARMMVSGCIIIPEDEPYIKNSSRLEQILREHPEEAPEFWIYVTTGTKKRRRTQSQKAIDLVMSFAMCRNTPGCGISPTGNVSIKKLQLFGEKKMLPRAVVSEDDLSNALSVLRRFSEEKAAAISE